MARTELFEFNIEEVIEAIDEVLGVEFVYTSIDGEHAYWFNNEEELTDENGSEDVEDLLTREDAEAVLAYLIKNCN